MVWCDIIDFLVEYKGYSKKSAFAKASHYKNKNAPINFTSFSSSKDLSKNFIQNSTINEFKKERKENFSRFWELLSKTMPTIKDKTKGSRLATLSFY